MASVDTSGPDLRGGASSKRQLPSHLGCLVSLMGDWNLCAPSLL